VCDDDHDVANDDHLHHDDPAGRTLRDGWGLQRRQPLHRRPVRRRELACTSACASERAEPRPAAPVRRHASSAEVPSARRARHAATRSSASVCLRDTAASSERGPAPPGPTLHRRRRGIHHVGAMSFTRGKYVR
jgi:hypothetical protein